VGRQGRTRVAAALVGSLLAFAAAPVGSATAGPFVSVIGPPTGAPMKPGFIGVSIEYPALRLYTGNDPEAINPVFVRLLRNLAPGQTPVVRVGGNSADATWWPTPGVDRPPGIKYTLNDRFLRTTRAFADALGGQLILDLNLAANHAAIAATEARAMLRSIGRDRIQAFELGNEADLYTAIPWYYRGYMQPVFSRPAGYDLAQFTSQFSTWRAALGGLPVAGPALADLQWMPAFDQFLGAEPGLAVATFHRYPLRGCTTATTSPRYATIANLLSDYSTVGQAQGIAPYVAMAHARGIRFRLDEINSVACGGSRGVSDTFAAALWALDTMFEMAKVGVDGVNVHTFPGAAYDLFTFTHRRGRWRAFVHPEYYGLLMFGQADPPGAKLLPVTGAGGPVKVWATEAPDGTRRFALINLDTRTSQTVTVNAGLGFGRATLERMGAPGAAATSDVVLGGQSFGAQTDSGSLTGAPAGESLFNLLGIYNVTLPPASAALLTL
jgi:Glycosyl hydrolase family 79 C-terminal beta domain